MGIPGFIQNLGYGTNTYWWIGVISAIVAILFLLMVIFRKGNIFFTKIIQGLAFATAAAIAVGAYRGYKFQRDVDDMVAMYQPMDQPMYQPMDQPMYQPMDNSME